MRRWLLSGSLILFALCAITASSWPDLVFRYEQWCRQRDEQAAAPVVSQLDIYTSLTLRLFAVAQSDDPYEVVRATSAARRCLNTTFDPLLAIVFSQERSTSQHVAHIVLGRAALLEGDVACAECELLASVASPPAARFYSPLPDMTLAHELLVRGRRAVVLRYLVACEPLWPANAANHLKEWSATIESGGIPDFDRWSAYTRVPNPGVQRTRFARR